MRFLRRLAYPTFECQNCIGMHEYGCQCAATGAEAPGVGPSRWRRALRWALENPVVIIAPVFYFTVLAALYLFSR
jgi:hypothetical protein